MKRSASSRRTNVSDGVAERVIRARTEIDDREDDHGETMTDSGYCRRTRDLISRPSVPLMHQSEHTSTKNKATAPVTVAAQARVVT
jgi:hypothetical protein